MDYNIAKILSRDLIVQETLQVSDLCYRINTTDYAHFKGNNFRKSPVNAATDSLIQGKEKKWTNMHNAKICLSL